MGTSADICTIIWNMKWLSQRSVTRAVDDLSDSLLRLPFLDCIVTTSEDLVAENKIAVSLY